MWDSDRRGTGDGTIPPVAANGVVPRHARESTALGRMRGYLVAAVCAAVGGLLLCSAPALALSQRGHVFGFTFGGKGAGEGQFAGFSGMAVHEVSATSDELYVADRPNNRVERFTCTVSETEHSCRFASQFSVPFPEGVAVDNDPLSPSAGDVYVGSTPKSEIDAVDKFTSAGEKLATMKGAKEGATEVESFEELRGVAVDSSGTVWVFHEETITGLSHAAKNQFQSSVPISGVECLRPGLAVGPTGENFYVGHEPLNHEEDCAIEDEEPPAEPPLVAKLNGSGAPLVQSFGGEPTTAAAVELSRGTVYVGNMTSIAAISSSGSLIQRFGAGHLTQGSAVAVDSETETVYVADAASGTVDVFTPEPTAAPTVDSVSSQNISPTATELKAQINPNGADTHYYFQYGTVDCAANPASCTDAPVAPPGVDIGAGFVDASESVQLLNLQPSTSYHYRVIAENQHGQVEGSNTLSTFRTLPTAVGVLADHRAWEMVSPPEKDGAGIEPIRREEGLIQASEDGDAIAYDATAPIGGEPQGSRSPRTNAGDGEARFHAMALRRHRHRTHEGRGRQTRRSVGVSTLLSRPLARCGGAGPRNRGTA